jgi:hypothetical protein
MWEKWSKFKSQLPDCFNGSYRGMRARLMWSKRTSSDSKHLGLLRFAGFRGFKAL